MDLWKFIEDFDEIRSPDERRTYNQKAVRIIETGMEFASVRACARYIGKSDRCVQNVLQGNRKTCGGYTFALLEDMEKDWYDEDDAY
jgi:hypothetical protein